MKNLPWLVLTLASMFFVGMLFFGTLAAAGFVGLGGSGGSSSGGSSGAVNCEGLKGVPDVWPDYFCGAGEQEKVDPAFIAAIIYYENRAFVKNPINHDWPCSPAAACGPAQFIPSTWESYKTDGKRYNAGDGGGDGRADINAVSDAVFASAKLHKANGATAQMTEALVQKAAALYNCGCTDWQGIPETADYVPHVVAEWKKLGGGG